MQFITTVQSMLFIVVSLWLGSTFRLEPIYFNFYNSTPLRPSFYSGTMAVTISEARRNAVSFLVSCRGQATSLSKFQWLLTEGNKNAAYNSCDAAHYFLCVNCLGSQRNYGSLKDSMSHICTGHRQSGVPATTSRVGNCTGAVRVPESRSARRPHRYDPLPPL